MISSQTGMVMSFFLSFQCWEWGCCSSRELWLPPFSSKICFVVVVSFTSWLLWSPLCFGDGSLFISRTVYADTFWDCWFPPCCKLCALIRSVAYWNSLRSHFPCSAVTADWLPVCNGWSSDYVGSRDGGLVCLIKLVARNHIDKARGLAFFSTTPE